MSAFWPFELHIGTLARRVPRPMTTHGEETVIAHHDMLILGANHVFQVRLTFV